MPDWVDWQNINERHKYIQQDNEPTCMVCGRDMTNHWFPKQNPKKVIDEAEQIVNNYNKRLLE